MTLMIQQGAYFSGGTPGTSVDTTPYAPGLIGSVVEINVGTPANPVYNRYKYVKAGGSVTTLTPVGPKAAGTEGDNTVYGDCLSAECIGVATATATTGQFFWVQVRGVLAGVVANGAIADGDQVMKRTTNADVITYTAAVTAHIIGYALGAAAGGIVTMWIRNQDSL